MGTHGYIEIFTDFATILQHLATWSITYEESSAVIGCYSSFVFVDSRGATLTKA
jgi:hypothetical protein